MHILIFVWIPILHYGQQGITNIWLLGSGWVQPNVLGCTQIDFKNNTLSISPNPHSLLFHATASTVADTQGNLLFATNGIAITDVNNDTMPNSINFNPGEFTDMCANTGLNELQTCLIIPNPGNNSQYYIFHQSAEFFGWGNGGYPLHLGYSVVDMNLRGGKGDVSIKNYPIINDTLENGLLSAVKHANGRDWWVVVPIPKSEYCYTLLVDNIGVKGPYLQRMNGVFWGWDGWSGFAVFPNNGEKYIRMERDIQLHIWDFDRCEGTFANHQSVLIDSIGLVGASTGAVSSNSQYLYVSKGDTILQFDLTQPDISASRKVAAIWDYSISPTNTYFGLMNLAPDGKIYMPAEYKMHIIHSPNSLGMAANVQQDAITLPTTSSASLPHHPNYFLGPLVGSKCDTLTSIKEQGIGNKEVQLYPNPASNFVTLSISPFSKEATCHFYTTLGECVKNVVLASEKTEIFVGDLPEGVYFYEVSSANTKHYGKFIIRR